MRRVVIYCLLILFALGTMMGCGGKGKYVGRYVNDGSVLELKSDGTYRYETKGEWLVPGSVTTGEWSVEKDDGDEIVSLLGARLGEPGLFKRSRQTGNLIGILGETFVKQN